MKKLALALAAAVLVAGCSTIAPASGSSTPAVDPIAQISTFTVADLQAADVDAVANGDQIAHACYPALEKFVQSLPNANGSTTVAGAFSAFQKARDLRNSVAAGVPIYLTMGCGPLYAQVHADFLAAIAGAFTGNAVATVVTAP